MQPRGHVLQHLVEPRRSVNANEIRGFENMNSVEGGDERFVQLSMQTVEGAKAQTEVQKKEADEVVSSDPKEEPSEEVVAEETLAQEEPQEVEAKADENLSACFKRTDSGIAYDYRKHDFRLARYDRDESFIASAFPMLSAETIDTVLAGSSTSGCSGIRTKEEQGRANPVLFLQATSFLGILQEVEQEAEFKDSERLCSKVPGNRL